MEWKDLFNYGLPTSLLVGLTFGLWQIVKWAKTAVVEPVVKNHLALIQTLQESVPKHTAQLENVARTAANVAATAAKSAEAAAVSHGKQLESLLVELRRQTEVLRGRQ